MADILSPSPSVAAAESAVAPSQARLPALDWMRGLVMVLITVDHASGAFNSGRLMTDSFLMYKAGTVLDAGQFLTRWITHLCAPTFVFLAGASLALSVGKRLARGESPRSIDRFIATRGLLIIALEVAWMSWAWGGARSVLQVLYAIGGSLVLMVGLRRLGQRALLAFALAVMGLGDVLTYLAIQGSGGPSVPAAFLLSGGMFTKWIVAYPLLPWASMMALGWVFGRWLLAHRDAPDRARRARRLLLGWGLAGLALFLVLRGLNSYGNMNLPRGDGSLVQWLHVSKYPPSLTFESLELGLMALMLAGFFALQDRGGPAPRWLGPLHVFGQTAFFFYLLHVHLLEGAAWVTGTHRAYGLPATYLAAAGAVLLLYPACRWYRGYKAAHPDGWTRYI